MLCFCQKKDFKKNKIKNLAENFVFFDIKNNVKKQQYIE